MINLATKGILTGAQIIRYTLFIGLAIGKLQKKVNMKGTLQKKVNVKGTLQRRVSIKGIFQ